MATGIRVYRPHRSDPEVLEKTSVGREPLLTEVLDRLEGWKPGKSRQHHLFIGPRGIGKTHLLRLVEHRILTRPELDEKWAPVVLPEDFYRVSRVSDLLLEMLKRLAEDTADEELAEVYEKTRYDEDDERVNDRCLDAFRSFHRESDCGVVLMLENLDRLLGRQMKKSREAHLFRKILMREEWLVLLASSPTYLDEVTKPEEPLFEFFSVHVVRELSLKQQQEMLRRLAAAENKPEIGRYIEDFRARTQAIYHFTGGNPRLSVMLYDLISKKEIASVRSELDLLLDQMTPFYQDRMRDVSDQEAKVLETIATLPEGCTPTELAQEARMPAKLVRAVLSRLTGSGYLRQEERKKKRTIYTMPERFFRIWHQMNNSRVARGRVQYLLEFFSSWYATRKERDTVWRELEGEFSAGLSDEEIDRLEDLAEYMDYIVAVSGKGEHYARVFDRLGRLLETDGLEEVERQLEFLELEYSDDSEFALQKGIFLADVLGEKRQALRSFEEAVVLDSDIKNVFNSAVFFLKNESPKAHDLFEIVIGELLSDQDALEPQKVASALGDLLLQSEDQSAVKIAAYLLAYRADRASISVLMRLFPDLKGRRKCLCINALGIAKATDAVALLISSLIDPANAVRGSAATALGRLGDPVAAPGLISALGDPDPINRGSAATALGRLGDPAAVPVLIDALRDPANNVRGSAATALGRLGDPAAVAVLIDALNDPANAVRGSAATALGLLSDSAAVPSLIGALTDPDPINRGSAARALGRLGDPAAIPVLIDALDDPANAVRGSAATALGSLGDPAAVPVLIDALDDPANDVRVSTVKALLRILDQAVQRGDKKLYQSVVQSLQSAELNDYLPRLLTFIIRSGDIGKFRRAVEVLQEWAEMPEIFWEPYVLGVEYLKDRAPERLERLHPEVREAVELIVEEFGREERTGIG